MECRSLEFKLISATDLKDVNRVSTMDVYAVVSIFGDAFYNQKLRTPVVKDSGPNPRWNHCSLKFTFPETPLQNNRLTFQIKLFSKRSLGDKEIGQIEIPVKELLDTLGSDDEKHEKELSYCVLLPKGKGIKGNINFSYKFGEKYTAPAPTAHRMVNEPVMAYPAGQAGSSQAYPPQQAAYPYPPSQPAGYGYPPPPLAGYPTYPAAGYGGYAKPQKPVRSGMGMGGGLGLGAGLLGGLLIGDMMCDVGEMAAYDAGYDAGIDADF